MKKKKKRKWKRNREKMEKEEEEEEKKNIGKTKGVKVHSQHDPRSLFAYFVVWCFRPFFLWFWLWLSKLCNFLFQSVFAIFFCFYFICLAALSLSLSLSLSQREMLCFWHCIIIVYVFFFILCPVFKIIARNDICDGCFVVWLFFFLLISLPLSFSLLWCSKWILSWRGLTVETDFVLALFLYCVVIVWGLFGWRGFTI